jgi:hypothetical protein
VKENQPTLCRDIRDYFECLDEGSCPDRPDDRWESGLEKDHGRIERRSAATVADRYYISSMNVSAET